MNRWLAVGIGVVVFIVLVGTAADYGLTYDEPIYMSKSLAVGQWLSELAHSPGLAFSRDEIARQWNPNDFQPGFPKLMAALAVGPVSHFAPGIAALRSGTCLLVAVLAACLFLWVTGVWGRAAGLYAVGALLFVPRVFAHSHLLALDAPIMAMTALTVACSWQAARTRTWGWAALAGVVWGLALNTKLNAFFVPFIVFPWVLLYHRRAFWRLLAAFVVLGPLVFFVTWPIMWFDTVTHFLEYFKFHLHHGKIGVLYFGQVYTAAPWHYPIVMTLFTTPPMLLGMFAFGKLVLMRQWRSREGGRVAAGRELMVLALWGVVVSILPSCLPGSPKYNGVRLFLPIFPLMAIMGAGGFAWIAGWVRERIRGRQRQTGEDNSRQRRGTARKSVRHSGEVMESGREARLVVALLLIALLAGPVLACVASHPYELSYYNAIIGGLPGAVSHGFEATYWGDTYLAAFGWLSEHARPNSVIWVEPPGLETGFRLFYGASGLLRSDLRLVAGPEAFKGADYAVTQNKPTEFTEITRGLVATRQPTFAQRLDGVPLVYVFDLREEQSR